MVVFVAWGLAQLSVTSKLHFPALLARQRNDSPLGQPNNRWNIFDCLLVILLVGFSAVRYFVGTDYRTYLSLHSAVDPSQVLASIAASPVEIGYTSLSIAVSSLTDFPYAIFWVTSILTVVPMYMAIKRSSLDLPFSILIYMLLAFYVSPFNMVRQGIAIALIFLAHTFYEKNRAVYYTLSVVAGLFHYTAWIAALAQWAVLRWRPSIRMVIYMVVGVFSVGVVFVMVNAINPTLMSSALGFVNPRYADYFEGSRSGIGTYVIIVTRAALLYLAFLLLKRSGTETSVNWSTYGGWFAYAALGICFLAIGTQAINVGRIDYYFSIFLVLLIPNLLSGVRRLDPQPKTNFLGSAVEWVTTPRNVKIGFLACGSLYFAVFISNFSDLVPYQTYFGQ
ncbi:capsular polysaccharide biosynthesis protein [Leifsonia rubra CMS 76R]|nr:capsular polysaccharide biosynthesis protein [Leifsonia rubra CMS 76R]